MRIVSIRTSQLAQVLAIVYAAFGLETFVAYAIRGAQSLTLPFGVLAPLIYLNVNLSLPRSNGVLYNISLGIAAMLSYALTGWITGIFLGFCFNFIAKKRGGIEAKYVFVADDDAAINT